MKGAHDMDSETVFFLVVPTLVMLIGIFLLYEEN